MDPKICPASNDWYWMPGADLGGRVQRDRVEQRKGGLGVFHRVERLHRVIAGSGTAGDIQRFAAQVPLVQKLGVLFLDGSGVGQHGPAQIGGAGAGIDGPVKSVLHQQRQVAAVIDVRMRQHHRGDVPAGKRKIPVALLGLLPASLILAAIQQIALAVHSQLMHGAGDGLGRAPECEFHPLKNKSFFRFSFLVSRSDPAASNQPPATSPQRPAPSAQPPIPSPQSPAPSPQRPVPSPQSPSPQSPVPSPHPPVPSPQPPVPSPQSPAPSPQPPGVSLTPHSGESPIGPGAYGC